VLPPSEVVAVTIDVVAVQSAIEELEDLGEAVAIQATTRTLMPSTAAAIFSAKTPEASLAPNLDSATGSSKTRKRPAGDMKPFRGTPSVKKAKSSLSSSKRDSSPLDEIDDIFGDI
jgi:hypothetical protein